MNPPEKDKLDGVIFLGFVEKKSPLKIEMVDFWTFRLKTTSKQVPPTAFCLLALFVYCVRFGEAGVS
jgi:hypothetical protein